MSSPSSRPKVLVTLYPELPKSALDLLESRCDVEWLKAGELVKNRIAGKHALFCSPGDRVDAELLDTAGPQFKVIGTHSAGIDHLDLAEIKKRGIAVGYTPDLLSGAVAEFTVALVLAAARRLFDARQEILKDNWASNSWRSLWLCGSTLIGATVGIVGLGNIGLATAKRLSSFEVAKILYTGRSPKPEAAEVSGQFVPMDQLLKESDFVIVTCSLNESTRNLFGPVQFAAMKPTAIFINTSRGAIVDQNALVEALKSGQIAGAGLDVMSPEPLPSDHELTKLNNCVLSPHIASATIPVRTAMAEVTARNILAGLDGKPMPSQLC